jgi:crossover junction endodeoxyribonuclease RuvC
MRVIGIDPGSRITGYGVIERAGSRLRHVASGCLRLPLDGGVSGRLAALYDGLARVLEEMAPAEAAVEKVFFARNAQSALTLGHARGVAMLSLVRHGIPVAEYSALEIKQAVVGRGRAEKTQVQHMVRALLGLTRAPQADAADALACAICHLHLSESRRRIAAGARAAEART